MPIARYLDNALLFIVVVLMRILNCNGFIHLQVHQRRHIWKRKTPKTAKVLCKRISSYAIVVCHQTIFDESYVSLIAFATVVGEKQGNKGNAAAEHL
jgi:hypothetical protein